MLSGDCKLGNRVMRRTVVFQTGSLVVTAVGTFFTILTWQFAQFVLLLESFALFGMWCLDMTSKRKVACFSFFSATACSSAYTYIATYAAYTVIAIRGVPPVGISGIQSATVFFARFRTCSSLSWAA